MKKFYILTLLLIFAYVLPAQSLDYSLQKPNQLYVGTPFNLHVEIHTSLQDSIFTPIIDTLDVFILTDIKSEDIIDGDSLTTIIDMTFQAFDTGSFTFPVLEYSVKSGQQIIKLKTNEFLLNIKSVLADSSKVILDIATPLKLKLGFWDYAIPILVVIALIAGGYSLRKYLKSRNRLKDKPTFVDNRPAWQIVLEELYNLKNQNLLAKGDFLIFHFRLSFLLRLFLELHYKVSAVEMTTSEIRENLTGIDAKDKSEILKFLTFTDRIKFAKFIPSIEESEQALTWLENYLLTFKEKSDSEVANA